MNAIPIKFTGRQLTKYLKELAMTLCDETTDDRGNPLTKGQAIAQLLFKKALGYTEIIEGESVYHRPESWAIQLIFERTEGRAPLSVAEPPQQMSAGEKVGELARTRLNSHTDSVVSVPERRASVDVSGDGDSGSKRPDQEPDMAGTDS